MTTKEKVIVSLYTGYLMCDLKDLYEYAEKLAGRPVFTHELAEDRIRNLAREDFLKLCYYGSPDAE